MIFLSRRDVAGLMPPLSAQLDMVESTYLEMAAGRVELPPKPGIHPRPNSFIHAMPAYLPDRDIAAVKWVSGYPLNKDKGLPYISGVIVLNDAETGLPSAVMDAAEITAARTAAASGVCIRRFAPAGWRTAAILGCGEQGFHHARVLAELRPDVEIHAYDPDVKRARRLEGPVEVRSSAREAVEGADVVITAGPIVDDPAPVISVDWLGPRHLVLPIDFDFYVRAETIEAASLFAVDDVEQFRYYRTLGHFDGWPDPDASVGDALSLGETHDRVACANLGVGALDAVFAAHVAQQAAEAGVGLELGL